MAIQRTDRVAGGLQVTTLSLDRPPANVIDIDHCRALLDHLIALRNEDTSRAVILRGAGRHFSTGVDIAQHTPELAPQLLPAFHAVFAALLDLNAVTIAAIHGYCLGGGAELALACDRVIATRTAKIGFPEIRVGCYPPVAVALLATRVGPGRATELILSGRDTFAELPLVDRLTDDLDAALTEELTLYADKSPAVLGMTAAQLHTQSRHRWANQIPALERAYLATVLPHPDATEGIQAFTQKRPPRWLPPPLH